MSDARHCQIGSTRKGLPCYADIFTLAGLKKACDVCVPHLQEMRDLMGWKLFRGRFFTSSKLADFQQDAVLDRINAETKASDLCEHCGQWMSSTDIDRGSTICDQCRADIAESAEEGHGPTRCYLRRRPATRHGTMNRLSTDDLIQA